MKQGLVAHSLHVLLMQSCQGAYSFHARVDIFHLCGCYPIHMFV